MIGRDATGNRRAGSRSDHGAPSPDTSRPAEPDAKAPDHQPGAEAEPSQPESVALAELQSENAALKDRLLRALAEAENVRRRAERDLADMRQYAVAKFAADLLPVADNLERAIASVPAESRKNDGTVKALLEGVELTEKELLRVLERHGVKKLLPIGERFDPNFHEALFEIPDPSVPDGSVSRIVEPGYSIGARPLRPAKVGVARGGPSGKPPSGR
ncbi:nucleotide exchange factor GrpE [Bosea sp. NPDC003192]|uniref:nucleotide exchange factor GrpE n=1 Tax=Bosea sp. NPDC003192 TaxID=3390551 RepID=UPI003D020768